MSVLGVLGFDNNGVKTGPRSTRLSNPEEHVTHYFNTYSKDMLIQVCWMVHIFLLENKVGRNINQGMKSVKLKGKNLIKRGVGFIQNDLIVALKGIVFCCCSEEWP